MTLIEAGQVEGLAGILKLRTDWLHSYRYPPDELVAERFVLYAGRAQSLSWDDMFPVQVIGALKAIALMENVPFFEQGTACKTMFPNDMLRALGVYQRGMEHANDAIRHGLWRAWNHHKLLPEPEVMAHVRARLEGKGR